MIWHLIGAIFAGLGAAGIGLLLRKVSGKRLPRWIIPALGGLGMLGYQIQTEYSWYEHKRSLLPESARVVQAEQDAMFWRPWTYLFPMTTAFSVVDAGTGDVLAQRSSETALVPASTLKLLTAAAVLRQYEALARALRAELSAPPMAA